MLNEKGVVKVMDFGIARVLGTARMTRQGSIVGTLEYMSPEQIQGMDSDARADIYSLGLLLYEMLTGRLPFASDTEFKVMMAQIQEAPPPPRTFAPHIPVAIEQAIMRALAKRPEARFQSASEFRAAIEGGLGLAPTQMVQPQTQAPPPTRLGTDPGVAMPTAGSIMKDTRLAPPGGYPPAYPQQQQSGFGQAASGYGQAYAPQPHTSLFSRLNWKHYAGAGVVLAVLMATPFALMFALKQQATPQKPATVGTPASAPSPATTAPQTPAQPLPGQTATQPLPQPGGASPGGLQGDTANPAPAPSGGGQDKAGQDRAGQDRSSRAGRRESDAAARERERKRAEARRLLDQ
jgi:serine/threonine-protein kinase